MGAGWVGGGGIGRLYTYRYTVTTVYLSLHCHHQTE